MLMHARVIAGWSRVVLRYHGARRQFVHYRLSPAPVIEMSVGARLKAAGDSLACVCVAGEEERRGEERSWPDLGRERRGGGSQNSMW